MAGWAIVGAFHLATQAPSRGSSWCVVRAGTSQASVCVTYLPCPLYWVTLGPLQNSIAGWFERKTGAEGQAG